MTCSPLVALLSSMWTLIILSFVTQLGTDEDGKQIPWQSFSMSLQSDSENTLQSTVDSRYFEVQGTLWNTSKYPYLDISDLLNWGKH